MPAPYLIGDERAFADFLTNTASQPVTVQTETVTGALTVTGAATLSGGIASTGGVTGLQTSTVAASAALNNVETVLLTFPLVAGTTLKVGTKIRITLEGTSTSTAANTTTFTIRAGTAGTTADASVAAFATAAAGTTGTAIPFKVVIDFVVRTLGASGTGAGSMTLVANAATAIGGAVTNVVPGTTATLATTTATFLDITHVTAATTTTNTFQDVSIEVLS